MTVLAFDLADEYRMPAMLLADGVLGQMMEPVDFDEIKVRQLPEKTWACNGHENKRKHNIINSLYIEPEVLENTVLNRYEKYKTIEEKEVLYEEYMTDDAEIILVSYGITSRVSKSAVKAARQNGIKAGLFRCISLYPFPSKRLNELTDRAKCMISVEMNMGQMINDIKVAIDCKIPVTHFGRNGGVIPTVDEIFGEIKRLSDGNKEVK